MPAGPAGTQVYYAIWNQCLMSAGFPFTPLRRSSEGKLNNEAPALWCKLLKTWSGRRGSNPRRPAWEADHGLKIQNLASMVFISSFGNYPVFNGLLSVFLNEAVLGQK